MKAARNILSLFVSLVSALAWQDGTGKLPAMGWNAWNAYECNINATLFLDQAQAMLDYRLLVCLPIHHMKSSAKQSLTFKIRKPDTNM